MVSQCQISVCQTKGCPCLLHTLDGAAFSHISSLQTRLIPLAELFRSHADLEDINIPLRDLDHSNTPNLPLHAAAFQLIGQLRVVGVDAEHVPRLGLVERLKQSVQRGLELAGDAGAAARRSRCFLVFLDVIQVATILQRAFDRVLPPCGGRTHRLDGLLRRDDGIFVPGMCLGGDRLGREEALNEGVVRP